MLFVLRPIRSLRWLMNHIDRQGKQKIQIMRRNAGTQPADGV